MRVLACAYKTGLGSLDDYTGSLHPQHKMLMNAESYATIESEMVFCRFCWNAGSQDPPRKEVKDAIADCKNARIGVIVITGDNKNTTEAICRNIGLFDQNENLSSKSFLGRDFMKLSQVE